MIRKALLVLAVIFVFYMVAYYSVAVAVGIENVWQLLIDFFKGLANIFDRLAR